MVKPATITSGTVAVNSTTDFTVKTITDLTFTSQNGSTVKISMSGDGTWSDPTVTTTPAP